MKACHSMKPVIAPIVCAAPRMAPLFDGSAAAISLVTSAGSSQLFFFIVLIWKQPSYRSSLSSPALIHSISLYLRLIFGSRSPQGIVFASPTPASTLPPQLFFSFSPSFDSRLVFPISLLAQSLTFNFPRVLVLPELAFTWEEGGRPHVIQPVIILPGITLGSVETFAALGLYVTADQWPRWAFRVQPSRVEAHQSDDLRPNRKWSCKPRWRLCVHLSGLKAVRGEKSAFKIKVKDQGYSSNI